MTTQKTIWIDKPADILSSCRESSVTFNVSCARYTLLTSYHQMEIMSLKCKTKWHNAWGELHPAEKIFSLILTCSCGRKMEWRRGSQDFDWRREKTGMFSLTNNGGLCVYWYKEWAQEPFVCLKLLKDVCVSVRDVCVSWRWLAGGRSRNVPGCSSAGQVLTTIIAWGTNRYGQIITWSEGTKCVPNMHSRREFFLWWWW